MFLSSIVFIFHCKSVSHCPSLSTEVDPLLTSQSVPAASAMKVAKQKINLIQKGSQRKGPCWSTRRTLESFYQGNVTNSVTQFDGWPLAQQTKKAKRDFGGRSALSITRARFG